VLSRWHLGGRLPDEDAVVDNDDDGAEGDGVDVLDVAADGGRTSGQVIDPLANASLNFKNQICLKTSIGSNLAIVLAWTSFARACNLATGKFIFGYIGPILSRM
jgi:hypothetical protein